MKNLIEEIENFIAEDAEDEVKDAGLIAEFQRVEHDKISGYGKLIRYAKELGFDNEIQNIRDLLYMVKREICGMEEMSSRIQL